MMRTGAYGIAGPILAVACGLIFAAGVVVGVVLAPWIVPPRETRDVAGHGQAIAATLVDDTSARVQDPRLPLRESAPYPSDVRSATAASEPPQVEADILPAPPPPQREVDSAVGGESEPVDPLAMLVARELAVPVEGVGRDDLRDSFDELRGGSRRHEAIDILAPRNTPVIAVEDGTIAKLFTSHGGGGLTIYQFDDEGAYAYYYAHLERYARGLAEGEHVRRGQVIGYVGTSGNAPPDTPHLHFAVYRLDEHRNWWEGDPLNPYQILRPRDPETPGR